MDEMNFRTALKVGYFDLQRHLRWYLRRCLGEGKKSLINEFILTQTKFLAPIAPHICEEIWEKLGNEGFITQSEYPKAEEEKINSEMESSEEYLINIISDVNEILKVTKIKPEKIVLYTPSEWKYKMYEIALDLAQKKQLNINDLMKSAMSNEDIKKHSKEAAQYAKKLAENLKNRGSEEIEKLQGKIDEKAYLVEAADFLKSEFSCALEIYSSDDENIYDPKNKAKFAQPARCAIFVE
jgi:leucyl-tRNA synthetase